MPQDVKVPRDDGSLLSDVDDAFVDLTLRHCKQTKRLLFDFSLSDNHIDCGSYLDVYSSAPIIGQDT